MNRRNFLTNFSILAGSSAALSIRPLKVFAAPKVRWRMALAVPKTLAIWGPGLVRFADNVEKLTEGKFKIRVYGAGELVPALGTFDSVKAGEIQMGHSASYYWQGKIPATAFFTAIPFGMDANCMAAWLATDGQKLWDELMEPHGVKCLPCGNTGAQSIGWYRKKINSLADIKGLKVRIPGIASKVFEKAGASPVLLAGGELYTSLATGVIDAVEWVGPYHDTIMGFNKAAKYYYGTAWHEPNGNLELMINKKAWEALPEVFQTAVQISAAETDRWMRMNWEGKNAEYYLKLKQDKNIEMLEFPEDVLEAFRKYTKEIITEISNNSPIAKKIVDSYSSFQNTFVSYQRWVKKGL